MMDKTPDGCPLNDRVARLEKRNRRYDRLAEIMFDDKLVGTRLTLAIAEFLRGITLVWPVGVFDTSAYTNSLLPMPAVVWGLLFLITAYVQFTLAMIGDFRCFFSRTFAAWNSAMWLFSAAMVCTAHHPTTTEISCETALAIAATWIFIRPLMSKKWEQS